ncbi:hypothetical protein [Xylanimonas protaetiae]|uniref:Permease n=1 Tax=Xylanimonas protaetiae TaxID=2509457 RepID=A0A4P6FF39_9MICO|nr:hypothetical protein [Xylanimonas protaetiae]QAY69228.1 hypothetical protein ET471_03550 [Xylanimonas protaetiae]
MSLSTRAVTTAVLCAAVAGAAFLGEVPLVGVAALLVVLLAVGWSALLDLPAPGGSTIVLLGAGLGAAAVAWRTLGEPVLRHLPIVVAMALVLAFLAEMLRRDGRPRLVESVTGTVAGAFVAAAAGGWIATVRSVGGVSLVVTAAVAVAVAAAVSALAAARGWVGALLAVAAAAVAGAVAAALVPDVEPVTGLVAGVAGGLGVAALRVLLERVPAVRGRRAGVAAATVPVAVGGMLVFSVGRVLLG